MNGKEMNNNWDQYALGFSCVTTKFQSTLYDDIANALYGNVGDFGAGSAKILPYINANSRITSYTGVDASEDMVVKARELILILNNEKYKIFCSRIEECCVDSLDSAVSINSYYAWSEPKDVLDKIYSTLRPGADFYLANPNKNLNMPALLEEASKENIMNPYYEQFKINNLSFDNDLRKNFVEMDLLVEQSRKVGFKVQAANQDYFLGGMNYLHLHKPFK